MEGELLWRQTLKMRCIIIVCEGQTKERFSKNVLGPYLEHNHVFVFPRLIPTSKKRKGGSLFYSRVKLAIKKMLRERNDIYECHHFNEWLSRMESLPPI